MDFDRRQKQTTGAVWAGPASLLFAILATAFQAMTCLPIMNFFGPILVFALAVMGVITGWIALRNARDNPENRTLGATGLVLSLINLMVSMALTLLQFGLVGLILGVRVFAGP